jgi:hypothetical protein
LPAIAGTFRSTLLDVTTPARSAATVALLTAGGLAMRAIVLRILALFGAVALSCAAWVLTPAEYALIAPLLPQQDGESVCLTGSFTSQVMNVEDWSKAKMEPTKHLSPDGKPYMRPVPPVMKDKSVRAFTLQLVYDTRTSDYDWIYNFRLAADVEGVGTMFAAGECPWYAKDKVWGWDKRQITGNTTDLYCYIDCDGGGFSLDRAPATPALLMSFDPSIGLKMKGGCGGGGIYRIKPATSGVTFRLQTASAETCRPLEEWASR